MQHHELNLDIAALMLKLPEPLDFSEIRNSRRLDAHSGHEGQAYFYQKPKQCAVDLLELW